jgi:hypothetical protein
MVKFRVFQNLSEQFLKIALSLKMTSNEKKKLQISCKFHGLRYRHNRVRMRLMVQDYGGI